MKKIILNLGCGRTYIKNAINVDFFLKEYCDKVLDLSKFPWPWGNNSIDKVYLLHFIEHFDSDRVITIFKKVYRILKVNGLLHIRCPHFSSMLSLADTTHKKAFSILSFKMLRGDFVFSKALFKTELLKIVFLATIPSENKYVDFDFEKTAPNADEHPTIRKLLWPLITFIQFVINLSPILFERFWYHWVGGADEIIYRGRKI